MNAELVEKVSRAIWLSNGGIEHVWENMREKEGAEGWVQKQRCIRQAKAAIQAIDTLRCTEIHPAGLSKEAQIASMNLHAAPVDERNGGGATDTQKLHEDMGVMEQRSNTILQAFQLVQEWLMDESWEHPYRVRMALNALGHCSKELTRLAPYIGSGTK